MSLEELFQNLSLSSTIVTPIEVNVVNNLNHTESTSHYLCQMNNMEFRPEYLKCVPEFDGNPIELNRYLTTCEKLINAFYDQQNPDNFRNTFLKFIDR